MPVYAATDGWKSEHVVAQFQIPGCFSGKKLIWGKGKGMYILDSKLDIGTIQWKDLRTRLRLTGGPGEREMILFIYLFFVFIKYILKEYFLKQVFGSFVQSILPFINQLFSELIFIFIFLILFYFKFTILYWFCHISK